MILYGSYADGTYDGNSDFDALLVVEEKSVHHDASLIAGVRLDAWLYTRAELEVMEPSGYPQLFGGKLAVDADGFGQALLEKLRRHVNGHACRPEEEKRVLRAWCGKMLERAGRGDDEGNYRACWLLSDSLELYCVFRDRFYFGPKKTIQRMKQDDAVGSALFSAALTRHSLDTLAQWIAYLTGDEGKITLRVEESGI